MGALVSSPIPGSQCMSSPRFWMFGKDYTSFNFPSTQNLLGPGQLLMKRKAWGMCQIHSWIWRNMEEAEEALASATCSFQLPSRRDRPWLLCLITWNLRPLKWDGFISKIPRPGGPIFCLGRMTFRALFLGPSGDEHRLFYLFFMFILNIPPGYREEANAYNRMQQY